MRPGDPINLQADERMRAVIVTARGSAFDQIQQIIEVLDKPAAYGEAEVLVIPLKKADAARLATVLTEMLRPDAAGNTTPEARALQEQVRLLKIRGAEDGTLHEVTELDLTKPIRIVADSAQQGSNSLIITSTPDNLKGLRAIVQMMDTVPLAEGVKVRLVHLKNADAGSVVQVVQQIFNEGPAAQAGQARARPRPATAPSPKPPSRARRLVSPLSVSVDARTNTLIVAGSGGIPGPGGPDHQ